MQKCHTLSLFLINSLIQYHSWIIKHLSVVLVCSIAINHKNYNFLA